MAQQRIIKTTIALFFILGFNLFATPIEHIYLIDTTAQDIRPIYSFPNEKGGYLLIGNIVRKDIGIYQRRSSGIFILNLILSDNNSDSLIFDFYNTFFVDSIMDIDVYRSDYNHTICQQRENGNIRIITIFGTRQTVEPSHQILDFCPYVIEFDKQGNLIHSFVDLNWKQENGGDERDQMVPFYEMIGRYGIILFNNSNNFAVINYAHKATDWTPHPNDTMYKYNLVARIFDSLGQFIELKPIIGLDTTLKNDSMLSVAYDYSGGATQKEDGTIELVGVRKREFYPALPGQPNWNYQVVSSYSFITLNSNFEVIKQEEPQKLPLTQNNNTYYSSLKHFDENNNLVYWEKMMKLNEINLNPDHKRDTNIKNIRISKIDTSNNSLLEEIIFHNSRYNFNSDMRVNFNGDYVFATDYGILWGDTEYDIENQSTYAAVIVSKDFMKMKVYENPQRILTNFFTLPPFIREDGKYEFWGKMYEGEIVRLVLAEEDFVAVNMYNGIQDFFLPTELNSKAYPNPTSATSTLTLDLETNGSLIITLNNLLGQELFELHNAFTDAGTFTKTFSIADLPIGIYYLKIFHNGNLKIEKVIKN